jgi:tetratricopeptide (TPR) repeat protein
MIPRFIPNDFLLLEDRLIRPPLQEWARWIRSGLEEELARKERDFCRVASLLNLAALVETSCGNLANGRAICEAELSWLSELVAQGYRRAEISGLAFQPWINIGRLLRLEGRIDEALQYFAIVMSRPVDLPLFLGPYSITGEDWEQLVSPEVLGKLWNIYIVDSLKSYFRARQFVSALRFIARLRELPVGSSANLVLEGEVLSHAGLGDYERAYALAKSSGDQEPLGILVFILYEASCSVALNELERGDSLARDLSSFITLGGLDSLPLPTTLQFLKALGALFEELGQRVNSAFIYDRGYQLAMDSGDQPFQIYFLRSKSRQLGGKPNLGLTKTLEALIDNCYYCELSSADRKLRNPAFDDLLATVSKVTGAAIPIANGDTQK